VFPAEWTTFLLGSPEVRSVLMELHPDLFEASFWQAQKLRIENGHIEDVFPYALDKRFGQDEALAEDVNSEA
jgi:isocitrate dehydrogenase kinase/phosphatase